MTTGEGGVKLTTQELIKLMARDIARNVIDELKREEIDPLKKKISALELKQNTSSTQLHTALDFLWRLAIIGAGIVSMIAKFHTLGWL